MQAEAIIPRRKRGWVQGWFFGMMLTVLLAAWGGTARAQSTLDAIRQRGKLLIGSDVTYPPFEWKNGDHFEGFDIDLGNEIGKELGVQTEWQNIAWDGIFTALQTKKFDLIMSDVVITDERKKNNAFSRPYLLSGQSVARRVGDTRIRVVEGLAGQTRGRADGDDRSVRDGSLARRRRRYASSIRCRTR